MSDTPQDTPDVTPEVPKPKYTPTVPLQETFDIVAKHLLTQNKRSYMPNESVCAYRGNKGFMCAAGCLIPDDKYKPEFERYQIYPSSNNPEGPTLAIMSLGHDLTLVRACQVVHDDEACENWPTQLVRVAIRFNLKPDIISTTLREVGREEVIPTYVLRQYGA